MILWLRTETLGTEKYFIKHLPIVLSNLFSARWYVFGVQMVDLQLILYRENYLNTIRFFRYLSRNNFGLAETVN